MSQEYHIKALEYRAAQYYAQLRLPKHMWSSIRDLEPITMEFEHLINAEEYSLAATIVDEIDEEYLFRWGYYERLINMRSALMTQRLDLPAQIHNLQALATCFYHLADFNQSISYSLAALRLMQGDDHVARNRTLGAIGNAYRALGENAVAQEYYQDAIKIAEGSGDKNGVCIHLSNLGTSYYYQAKYDKAVENFSEALNISRNITHDKYQEQRALVSLGNTTYHTGDFNSSLKWNLDALIVAESIGSKRVAMGAYGGLGRVYTFLGEYDKAIQFHLDGLHLAQETGSRDLEGVRFRGLALAHLGLEDYETAYSYSKQALDISIEVKAKGREHEAQAVIAQVLLHLGQPAEALNNHLEKARTFSFPPSNHQISLLRGIALLKMGDLSEALFSFNETLEHVDYLTKYTSDFTLIEYTRCLALLGVSFSIAPEHRKNSFDSALKSCQKAVNSLNAKGVIEDALRLIREFPSNRYLKVNQAQEIFQRHL